MKKNILLSFYILIISTLVIAACQKEPSQISGSKKLVIVATLFPLYDFAREITAGKADVTLLLPPGVEAHSFEPKPGDMITINSADVFLYTGKYMEPWVEKILQSVDNKKLVIVDASKDVALLTATDGYRENHNENHNHGHEHGAYDPHIWLDFTNAQKMVDNILDGLIRQDPANKDIYTQNAVAYKAKLQSLDDSFKHGLSTCRTNVFIHGGHFAFNYLASRYNLRYVSAYGMSPNAEPTSGKIMDLKKSIREQNIKHIFYEELITPRIANMLNKETGVRLLKLNGAHNISKDDLKNGKTFVELMEGNLNNLKVGLECR